MPTICHFEIPGDDLARAKKFYEQLFDWKFELFAEWEYYGITTGPVGKSVGGGMMKRMQPQQPILVYFDVAEVEEYATKIIKLGGQVVKEKTPVPGMGWFAICLDSENNPFGLWQIDSGAK